MKDPSGRPSTLGLKQYSRLTVVLEASQSAAERVEDIPAFRVERRALLEQQQQRARQLGWKRVERAAAPAAPAARRAGPGARAGGGRYGRRSCCCSGLTERRELMR